jgi:hypothetical protein
MAALKIIDFFGGPRLGSHYGSKAVVTPMVHAVGSESSLGEWFWGSTVLRDRSPSPLCQGGLFSRVYAACGVALRLHRLGSEPLDLLGTIAPAPCFGEVKPGVLCCLACRFPPQAGIPITPGLFLPKLLGQVGRGSFGGS